MTTPRGEASIDTPAVAMDAAGDDLLARFIFAARDDDADDAGHAHGEHCECQMRGH